ncbi:cytochrome P450 [Streptomyces niveus]|uniref:cytochrome P450 n=1 Tax=Streptomyces niveus TaxID=193462 RepID=UPI00342D63BA
MSVGPTEQWPASGIDLLSPAVLAHPAPYERDLRDLGACVRLTRHDVLGVFRDAEARAVLEDEADFQPMPPAVPVETAAVPLVRRTALAAVDSLGGWIDEHAARLTDETLARGEVFDGAALARRFLADVVIRMTGLSEDARDRRPFVEAVDHVTGDGAGAALLGGSVRRAAAMAGHLRARVSRESVAAGSWMDTLFGGADVRGISDPGMVSLAAECVTTGLDTAVHGICCALHTLTTHPWLWADLRELHVTGAGVFHEALRLDPLIPGAYRRAARDTIVGGLRVRPGEVVWVSSRSADSDPRRWGEDANRVIVPRARSGEYLAFGTGPFSGVGKTLAEHAADRLLAALAYRCTGLALSGEPERLRDTPGRPWVSLSLKATLHGGRRRTVSDCQVGE